MFTDDRKRYMSVWICIPLILSLRPEYSYWDQNLPFSSLSDETKRHPLLSHTACVPFPRIVICLWGLNLYQVTFYQREFSWNLIEFSPHGDIPIFSFSYLTHAKTCYIARSLTLTNGYGANNRVPDSPRLQTENLRRNLLFQRDGGGLHLMFRAELYRVHLWISHST